VKNAPSPVPATVFLLGETGSNLVERGRDGDGP